MAGGFFVNAQFVVYILESRGWGGRGGARLLFAEATVEAKPLCVCGELALKWSLGLPADRRFEKSCHLGPPAWDNGNQILCFRHKLNSRRGREECTLE